MPQSLSVVLTGANTGLGLGCAKKLCKYGHDVLVTVRDDAKGQATVDAIISEIPDAKITFMTMDLGNFQSIRVFVDQFHSAGRKLDLLINNAGVFPPYMAKERLIANNDPKLELSMTVNCLGPFLLTNLLLDDLKASSKTQTPDSPARIVNVSTLVTVEPLPGMTDKFDIDDLMLEKPKSYNNGGFAYRHSKIGLNLWSNELAKMLEGSGVTVGTVCPGVVPDTDLGRMVGGKCLRGCLSGILGGCIGRNLYNSKTIDEGSDQILEVALDPAICKTTGLFYRNHAVSKECPKVMDENNQQKIWEACKQYTDSVKVEVAEETN